MSDDEDADLENLRQLALSSLLKKKSVPLQTNAVFYRPVSNSNLISIQPVQEVDDEDDENGDGGSEEEGNDDGDEGSSSGSEYAVIEEGLSVSSGDVDQVIEEIIISGEEGNGSEEEDEAEDAVSIASHDSFDEILNSVEEEIRGAKRRPSTGGNNIPGSNTNGPSESKRLRPDVVPVERKEQPRVGDRRVRSRSPAFRESYQREYEKPRQVTRKPGSPNYHRNRRSSSPRNLYRHRSPLNRRTSKSPTENRKPKPMGNSRRKSPSPITLRRHESGGVTTGRDYQRQVRRRPSSRTGGGQSRSQAGSDSEKQAEEVRRQYNNRRRSPERRRSRSPPKKLSFGDHRLRTRVRPGSKPSSRNPSRQSSRERTRSPGGKRQERTTKSPERKQSAPAVKTRSPSPTVDISNLTPDERARLEKRKLKFQSKASGSGKVILKPKENTSENHAKVPKVPITFDSTGNSEGSKRKTSTTNPNPISSRLGHVMDPEKDGERGQQRHHRDRPKSSKSATKDSSRRDVEDFSNNNNSKRSPLGTSASPPKTVGEDDLRTKLQQKRANANVGRIFTVALKDTIQKDTSVSPRN